MYLDLTKIVPFYLLFHDTCTPADSVRTALQISVVAVDDLINFKNWTLSHF